MLRNSALVVAMAAAVSVSSVAAAAPLPVSGLVRNQAALGVAGRVTPAMRVMAQQCGTAAGSQSTCLAANSQKLEGATFGGGSLIVLVAALIAAGGGFYFAFHHKHHHNNGNPVSS